MRHQHYPACAVQPGLDHPRPLRVGIVESLPAEELVRLDDFKARRLAGSSRRGNQFQIQLAAVRSIPIGRTRRSCAGSRETPRLFTPRVSGLKRERHWLQVGKTMGKGHERAAGGAGFSVGGRMPGQHAQPNRFNPLPHLGRPRPGWCPESRAAAAAKSGRAVPPSPQASR